MTESTRRPWRHRIWWQAPYWPGKWWWRHQWPSGFRSSDEWDWHTIALGLPWTGAVIVATRPCQREACPRLTADELEVLGDFSCVDVWAPMLAGIAAVEGRRVHAWQRKAAVDAAVRLGWVPAGATWGDVLLVWLAREGADESEVWDDVRASVSRLWAEDWDSPEDAVYDEGDTRTATEFLTFGEEGT